MKHPKIPVAPPHGWEAETANGLIVGGYGQSPDVSVVYDPDYGVVENRLEYERRTRQTIDRNMGRYFSRPMTTEELGFVFPEIVEGC